MIANSIPARLVATRMRVALPRACTCHCYAHAHGHTMRACARPYHAHVHGYDMVRAELWKRCAKPSWQTLTPLPLLTGNAHMEKTHFKKGLPWLSQRPFDIIFNRTFLGIRWSSNHHTTLLKIVAIFFYQAHWAWIFNSENKMEKQDKPSLLKMIRKLVYSRTNEEFNNEWQTMKRNQTFLKYEKYAQLINE